MPVTTSTSTSTSCPDIPESEAEKSFCIQKKKCAFFRLYQKTDFRKHSFFWSDGKKRRNNFLYHLICSCKGKSMGNIL
jgi:hypothetical protein